MASETKNYGYPKPDIDDFYDVGDFNKAMDMIDEDMKEAKKSISPEFTQAEERKNIESGEKLSVIFGKVKKFFADLKKVAFSGSYNDLDNKPTIPAAVRVKGNAESAYRTGDVNITPDNIGLGNVNNTADSSKNVATAKHLTVEADNYKQGTDLPSTYPRGETIFFSNNPTNKFNGIAYCTIHTIKGYTNMACIQFLYPYNTNADKFYFREALYNADTWRDWQEVITSANIGSQSVSYAASAGNAATATKATHDGNGNDIVPYIMMEIDDLDDLVTPGLYSVGGTYIQNKPTDGFYFNIIVFKNGAGSYVNQLIMKPETTEVYVRYKKNSGWGSWVMLLRNTDTVEKAKQDSDGNVIKDSYAVRKKVTGEDFNSMRTPGLYTMKSCSNSPDGVGYCGLLVIQSDTGNYIEQLAFKEGTTDIYIRYLYSSDTWSDWKQLYVEGNITTGIKKDIADIIYPIGSIYMSVNSTSPATLFGGTWERWGNGRVAVGVDTSQTEFSTVEKIGGNKTHTLTAAEMPSHSHSTTSQTLKTTSNGNHQHKLLYSRSTTGSGNSARVTTDGDSWLGNSATESTGAHTHDVTIPALTTDSKGSGSAHNNLQPYITCYMWKRTA